MSASDYVKVVLFAPISVPVLSSVHLLQIANIFVERERYEMEVASKDTNIPT